MKRKLILLPITLTALTPMSSVVGCKKINYQKIELEKSGGGWRAEFTAKKGNYYVFLLNDFDVKGETYFLLGNADKEISLNYDLKKILVDHKPVQAQWVEHVFAWKFNVAKENSDIEIYVKSKETAGAIALINSE